MLSRISEFVFSEPAGRLNGALMFSGSLVFITMFVYFNIQGSSPSISGLVIAVGFALSGIAESLPKKRNRAAGWLRLTASVLVLGLLALTIFTPEIIIGEP